jgi:hypothetical protein
MKCLCGTNKSIMVLRLYLDTIGDITLVQATQAFALSRGFSFEKGINSRPSWCSVVHAALKILTYDNVLSGTDVRRKSAKLPLNYLNYPSPLY